MDLSTYLGHIAKHLAHQLEPIVHVKELTSNSELLGAYTEAAVRDLARRVVSPMRVSRGAVIDHPMPAKLRHVDLILWAPFPAPAIFDLEDFGLVPRSSAFGLIEVKRSNYSGVEDDIESFLHDVDTLTADRMEGVAEESTAHGLAVVAVINGTTSARLQKLLSAGGAVAIFSRNPDASLEIRHQDVLRLVNFLHAISWRERMQRSVQGYPQLFCDFS